MKHCQANFASLINNMEYCGLKGKVPIEFLNDFQKEKSVNYKLRKPIKVLA